MAKRNELNYWTSALGKNPHVDAYFSKAQKWREELEKLREILLDCQLTEELKWAVPCYTFQGRNIVGINGLKESCALAFFKGALLEDAVGILIKPGENTQAGRWMKFTSVQQIVNMESTLKAYIYEAIEVEKAGLTLSNKKKAKPVIPKELEQALKELPDLKAAFDGLTPGRQRGYILYFSAAKQSKTRQCRVEKCMRRILDGKGLNDG